MPEAFLKPTAVQVDPDGKTIRILAGIGNDQEQISLAFQTDQAELLLSALASALGQAGRLQQKDPTVKRVLPSEWWEINPHPHGDGLLFSFRLPGGMEITFHLGSSAIPHFEDVLRSLTGTRTPEAPLGARN